VFYLKSAIDSGAMENYTPMWQVPTCEPKPIKSGVTGITWSAITLVVKDRGTPVHTISRRGEYD